MEWSIRSLITIQGLDSEAFLFSLKDFVRTGEEARTFLFPEVFDIPKSGQVQDLVAGVLKDNNVEDIFHVNLVASNGSINDSSSQKLEWQEGGTSTLDLVIYQDGTEESLGNCGQFEAAGEGLLDISSNNCSVKLKPLCMRSTSLAVTELESREGGSTDMKEAKLDRTVLRRWKRRMRQKMRKSRHVPRDSQCEMWTDIELAGGLNLGQICTQIDRQLPFDSAGRFCEVRYFSRVLRLNTIFRRNSVLLCLAWPSCSPRQTLQLNLFTSNKQKSD